MNLRTISKAPKEGLIDIYSEVFTLILELRRTDELVEPELLQSRLISLMERLENNADESGYHNKEIEMARFALVALIDETVRASGWANAANWIIEPLGIKFYKRQVAGEEFFTRLDLLRKKVNKYYHLIEIYYLCLLFGFQGKYGKEGKERLDELKDDIYEQLRQIKGGFSSNLSPHGERKEKVVRAVKELPPWLVPAIAFGLVVILFMILNVIISDQAIDVKRVIERIP